MIYGFANLQFGVQVIPYQLLRTAALLGAHRLSLSGPIPSKSNLSSNLVETERIKAKGVRFSQFSIPLLVSLPLHPDSCTWIPFLVELPEDECFPLQEQKPFQTPI